MPCKKENCKCYKCGKIADKDVDTKLLSNSSTSDLNPEEDSPSDVNPNPNTSSQSKSSFVVYKQYKSESIRPNNDPLTRLDEEPFQEKSEEFKLSETAITNENVKKKSIDSTKSENSKEQKVAIDDLSSFEFLTKFERLQDQPNYDETKSHVYDSHGIDQIKKIEKEEIKIQVKQEKVDGYTSQINLTRTTSMQAKPELVDENTSPIDLVPTIQEDRKTTTDFIPPPPVCPSKRQDDNGINNISQLQSMEDEVPVRKFSLTMREDVDKPLQPLQHHESNRNLPLLTSVIEDNLSSDEEYYDRLSEKGYLRNIKELKSALQLIVDASDKILNTLHKSRGKQGDKDDEQKKDGKNGPSGKNNKPYVYNVHNIKLDSSNPLTINLPLHLHFSNNGNIKINPMRPIEFKTKSFVNDIKTSSESVNIHYPKTPYKTLSSEFVITENVLVNGYTNEIPVKQDNYNVKLQDDSELTDHPREKSLQPSTDMDENKNTNVYPKNQAVTTQDKNQSFKDSDDLNDNINLKLPVNFPQQRNIKVCVPCYCDTCPLFNNDGDLICPEKCGCCTCAYTINEANPDDRTELELCRCTSKTQFNTIGRSYVSRCQCSRRVDLCPCRDKYGSLGEQVAEFEDDKLKDIKKRKSTRKSTLRMSRLSRPLLLLNNDSFTNENTTTDNTGKRGNDGDDQRILSKATR